MNLMINGTATFYTFETDSHLDSCDIFLFMLKTRVLCSYFSFSPVISSPPPLSLSAAEFLPAPHSSPARPVPVLQPVSGQSLSLPRHPCRQGGTRLTAKQREIPKRKRREERRSLPDWVREGCFSWE